MSNMLMITFGVGIAAYGEAKFNLQGVTFQLSAVVVEATRLVLIQVRGCQWNHSLPLPFLSVQPRLHLCVRLQ